ncbi:hypothetical protein HCH_01415 [Hahella chejuensis KCTC 2396]|uniref:Uncharacterized protein n=1 Tax=Hahella chejuensis (strain KCTC 2396) TaxID=349521 RepID=Q2SM47_HAHCH|nr:hypothetical protein HCH_01415 [Hahella chejuensis KCTC 2396]
MVYWVAEFNSSNIRCLLLRLPHCASQLTAGVYAPAAY